MAVRKPITGQIENRNFLAPTGFHFQVQRAPKVSYFGNAVNIPSITLGVAAQPNYLRGIPLPGDMMDFDDLTLRFLVDENLENYMEIQHWMRGLGFPESLDEIYNFQREDADLVQPYKSQLNLYSDGTLTVLDSMNNAKFKIVFENMFPYALSTLDFDATQTDLEYFTAEVSFKYTIYNIREINCDQC
jgi:hypothetical protein